MRAADSLVGAAVEAAAGLGPEARYVAALAEAEAHAWLVLALRGVSA